MEENQLIYREVQRFKQPLLWALLIAIAVLCLYAMAQQLVFDKPFGNNPAPDYLLIILVVVFSFGLPALFYAVNLATEVRSDGLYIRFFPFHLSFRKTGFDNLAGYEAQTYRALRDYGGWGIRYGRKGKAYNVSGNRGVQLEFANGDRLLIGSQRPDELVEALDAASAKKERQ